MFKFSSEVICQCLRAGCSKYISYIVFRGPFACLFWGCGVPMCTTSSKINNVCISLAAVSHKHLHLLILLSLKP
jgi:hypothetical protein